MDSWLMFITASKSQKWGIPIGCRQIYLGIEAQAVQIQYSPLPFALTQERYDSKTYWDS